VLCAVCSSSTASLDARGDARCREVKTELIPCSRMSYPQHPPGPKHAPSSYSSGSSDPFNASVQQLPYGDQQPMGAYANPGAPNPGAGNGAGVAPPGQGGQYAPYYDNDPEMAGRYDGGGAGRETWASESGWSGNGELKAPDRADLSRCRQVRRIFRFPTSAGLPPISSIHPYIHRG
jgi:1,3-beta-glucan synthase